MFFYTLDCHFFGSQKSRETNRDLQIQLDQVVQQAQDPNSKGNSLFAEVIPIITITDHPPQKNPKTNKNETFCEFPNVVSIKIIYFYFLFLKGK